MKNLRRYSWLVLLGLSASMVMSCGLENNRVVWVHENLAPIVRFEDNSIGGKKNENSDRVFFWRGANISLTTDPDALMGLREKTKRGSLVMVSFEPGSEVGRYLSEAPSTWAFYTNPESADGKALVYVQDGFTLDGLAALAHRERGCGAVERLSLVHTSAGAGTVTPPVYDEFVSLSAVKSVQDQVSATNILTNIGKLEALGTRHHSTDTGLASTDLVETMFKDAASGIGGFKTEQVSHSESGSTTATEQKSVVATIPGTNDDSTIIVIGAHLDSINNAGVTQNAPGADDDASGIATLTEVLRVIAANKWTFNRRIEFHGYAAEEVGLIGSNHIAQTYSAAGKNVAAMLQVDMNSWSQDPSSTKIHLVDQFTFYNLNRSVKDLLHNYLGGDFEEKTLKGGTSDHKSWFLAGYPSVFPFEDPANYNTALHSLNDTSGTVNNTAMSARFAKMILAFLAHHAGLVQGSDFSSGLTSFRASTPKDLFLAISPASSEGFYSISVSAPPEVTSVEVCLTNAAGSAGCIEEKERTAAKGDLSGRQIFSVFSEFAIEDGNRLAVFGYDSADKINALRTVQLTNATQP